MFLGVVSEGLVCSGATPAAPMSSTPCARRHISAAAVGYAQQPSRRSPPGEILFKEFRRAPLIVPYRSGSISRR